MAPTIQDKRLLTQIAREAIETELGIQQSKNHPLGDFFLQKAGAFVTLEKKGRLRGCIGFIEVRDTLINTVRQAAIAAAFEDDRFDPIAKEEMDDLQIEISVISPMRLIKSTEEIIPGEHGIFIHNKNAHGLLLPQVATEYGWDRKVFLEQTCIKAGLPKDAWQWKDTTIEVFTATVFSESELGKT